VSGSEWGTKWPKKRLGGVEYDLSHLNPFAFEAIPGDKAAPRILVGVSFSLHTFTEDRKPEHRPDTFMGNANDPRSFCTHRHKCSLHLPKIIRGIAAGTVSVSRDSYMIVSSIDCAEGEYATIFLLKQSKGNVIPVRMHVISAHERTRDLGYMKEVSFYSLVRRLALEANWEPQKEIAPAGAISGIPSPLRESVVVNDDAVALRTSRSFTRKP
jgi:hypothetical protein